VRVLINVRRDQWRKEEVRKHHQLELRHATAQHDNAETAFLSVVMAPTGPGAGSSRPSWLRRAPAPEATTSEIGQSEAGSFLRPRPSHLANSLGVTETF
jgi:hypothetical protein